MFLYLITKAIMQIGFRVFKLRLLIKYTKFENNFLQKYLVVIKSTSGGQDNSESRFKAFK